jgi:predicted pyridoxine 5'-phosphate oxidase superfamily flavin-nucleotide-binding protein
MIIIPKVKQLFESTALVAFATADADGKPNVVPVFWKMIRDDQTILLVDNYFKTTKANLLINQQVCISFWNADSEEAYKLKGVCTYHTSGPVYEQGKSFMQARKPDHIPHGVAEIRVEKIYDSTPGPTAGQEM